MVSGFELRFATALRDWIQDQRSQFFEEFDAIDLSHANSIARVGELKGRFTALEEVLMEIDEIQEELSKEG